MSVKVLKLDGTVEETEPTQETCKDAMISKGIVHAPSDSFQVLCEGQNVDYETLANFDGKKLVISPTVEKGGF